MVINIIARSERTGIPLGLKACHHPNLDSVVINDGPLLQRAFVATDGPGNITVAPHSHRTSIRITVLRGIVWHHTFSATADSSRPSGAEQQGRLHTYQSKLLGGTGLSREFSSVDRVATVHTLNVGDSLFISSETIHTVYWTPDAMWTIDEGPVVSPTTKVFIRDGIDSFVTAGLYQAMSAYEYADLLDKVVRRKWEVELRP